MWGVTATLAQERFRHAVSIHTPVWGVTSAIRSRLKQKRCFNPHARVGRDKNEMKKETLQKSVNPHARVGRDWGRRKPSYWSCGFNPHARVGRDCLCFYDMCFSALIGVKCESLGLHLQKYSFFIEFASNILIIKWCERIGISALLMVLVYIIRSALKLKELSIPMCSTFPSQ